MLADDLSRRLLFIFPPSFPRILIPLLSLPFSFSSCSPPTPSWNHVQVGVLTEAVQSSSRGKVNHSKWERASQVRWSSSAVRGSSQGQCLCSSKPEVLSCYFLLLSSHCVTLVQSAFSSLGAQVCAGKCRWRSTSWALKSGASWYIMVLLLRLSHKLKGNMDTWIEVTWVSTYTRLPWGELSHRGFLWVSFKWTELAGVIAALSSVTIAGMWHP